MTHYRAGPCPCEDDFCKDWHVEPVAAMQGVKFTEAQAKKVAILLNGPNEMAETFRGLIRAQALKEAAEIAGNWAPNVAREKIAELAQKKGTAESESAGFQRAAEMLVGAWNHSPTGSQHCTATAQMEEGVRFYHELCLNESY